MNLDPLWLVTFTSSYHCCRSHSIELFWHQSHHSRQCLNLWGVECNWSETRYPTLTVWPKVQSKLSKLHFKNIPQRNLFVFCNSWPNFVEWIRFDCTQAITITAEWPWEYLGNHPLVPLYVPLYHCVIVPPLPQFWCRIDTNSCFWLLSFVRLQMFTAINMNVRKNFSESNDPSPTTQMKFSKLILIRRVICDAHRENDRHWQRWCSVVVF